MSDGYIIKGKLTGLTPAEKMYLLTHPWHISTIKENADKALAEAQRRYAGAGLHNGNGDAFRHCYWSALLARDIGPENALTFTTAHEAYSGNPAGEREMDLHNNAVGVGIGRASPKGTDQQLANQVVGKLLAGQLMTAPGSTGKPY